MTDGGIGGAEAAEWREYFGDGAGAEAALPPPDGPLRDEVCPRLPDRVGSTARATPAYPRREAGQARVLAEPALCYAEGPVVDLFQPDTMLPEQWTSHWRQERATPEQRLMLSIIVSAVEDIRLDPTGPNGQEALQWIRDLDGQQLAVAGRKYPFTFRTVVELTLHLDAEVVAAAIRRRYTGWDRRHRLTKMRLTGAVRGERSRSSSSSP